MPAYILEVGKGGPKLPPPNDAKAQSVGWVATDSGVRYRGIALDEMLRPSMFGLGDRPIFNRTGLDGRYNLVLKWKKSSPPAQDSTAPTADGTENSIFAALEDLGLRLVPGKGPVEIVVVDNVELPSEN